MCETEKSRDCLKEDFFNDWTDYWVSQGRKFCEFCKCSIADNKPSIQFHENGKKHKENVAKRLSEMQKKASKDAKDAQNFEREMKRIEAAALRAYVNDVKDNADYTSQLVLSGIETLPTPEIVEPAPKPKLCKKPDKKPAVVRKWMEAKSEDGKTYYWNVETGESVWERPAEGYLSIVDQEKQKSNSSKPKNSFKGKKHKKFGKSNSMKHKTKATPLKEEEKKQPIDLGFFPQSHPYGKWEKVEVKKQEPIDLQLPVQDYIPIQVPKLREEQEKRFKEKIIEPGVTCPVISQGETGFKKRKLGSDFKKNMRQRLKDD